MIEQFKTIYCCLLWATLGIVWWATLGDVSNVTNEVERAEASLSETFVVTRKGYLAFIKTNPPGYVKATPYIEDGVQKWKQTRNGSVGRGSWSLLGEDGIRFCLGAEFIDVGNRGIGRVVVTESDLSNVSWNEGGKK